MLYAFLQIIDTNILYTTYDAYIIVWIFIVTVFLSLYTSKTLSLGSEAGSETNETLEARKGTVLVDLYGLPCVRGLSCLCLGVMI